jgi:hypothetical protein
MRREIQDGLSNKRRVALAVFAGFPRNQRPLCHVHHYAAILPAAGTAYAGLAPVAVKSFEYTIESEISIREPRMTCSLERISNSHRKHRNIETLSVFS